MSKFDSIVIVRHIFLIILLFFAYEINAQQKFHSKAVTITIKGTSNIHNWSSETNEGIIDMSAQVDSSILKSINSLKATIMVNSIKSSKGSMMDKNMYKTLKADAYPEIVYTLEKIYKIQNSGRQYTLGAIGNLNIAGVTRKIDLSILAFIYSEKSIKFSFSKKIKMSDFNIKPPVALFGLIRTGDMIELVFDFAVKGG